MSDNNQHTLAKEVALSGVGLHSGKPVDMRLLPAATDTGIVFVRTDLEGNPSIHACPANITSTVKATTLSENGGEVHTVEHLMAAFAMTGVDNCIVEMNSPEPPVADGSALSFVQLIKEAGLQEQEALRRLVKLDKTYTIYKDDVSIVAVPYSGFRISFTSINSHPLLGTQMLEVNGEDREYLQKEIAPARTVAFAREIEAMQKAGLGLGGTLDNVVVFDEEKVLSELRFSDELIRHKVLDLIGDFYQLGHLHAHIIAVKSGHALNAEMTGRIYEDIRKKAEEEERKKHMIKLDVNEIKKIIAHRYPMLLIDRIIDLEPMKRAVGIKNITINEMQFLGHFPENPIMPGVLLIEAMAQVGGVAMLYPEENRGKIAMFVKIDNVRFRKPVVPGDQLITTCEVTKIMRASMGIIHCEGKVDGKVACECDCTFKIMDR